MSAYYTVKHYIYKKKKKRTFFCRHGISRSKRPGKRPKILYAFTKIRILLSWLDTASSSMSVSVSGGMLLLKRPACLPLMLTIERRMANESFWSWSRPKSASASKGFAPLFAEASVNCQLPGWKQYFRSIGGVECMHAGI